MRVYKPQAEPTTPLFILLADRAHVGNKLSARLRGKWARQTMMWILFLGSCFGTGVHAQEPKLVSDVEQNVQRLIDRHSQAVERAKNTANPLQRKPPSSDQFNQDIKQQLDRLLGKEIVLETAIAGFLEEDGRIHVAFLDSQWLDDPASSVRTLRFRLNADQAIKIVQNSQFGQQSPEENLARFHEIWLAGMLAPHLSKSSPISVVGEVGVHVERHIAEGFELGEKYKCRLRVVGYSSSWGRQDSPEHAAYLFPNYMNQAMAEERPELAKLLEAANQPFIEIQCEWVRTEAEIKIADLDVHIQGNPGDSAAYARRGNFWHARNEYAKAIDDLDQAITLDATQPRYFFARGTSRIELGDFQSAADDFRQVVQLDPHEHNAWNRWGFCLLKLGQYEESIAHLNRAVELSPQNVAHYDLRGATYLLNRQFKEAIADYDHVLQADPNNHSAKALRGWAYMGMGDYDHALSDLQASLTGEAELNIADFGLAFLKASSPRSGDRDGIAAISQIQKHLTSLEKLNANQLNVVAASYAEAGQFEKAVEFLTLAIERVDVDPVYRSHQEELWDRLALYQSNQPYRQMPLETTKTSSASSVEGSSSNEGRSLETVPAKSDELKDVKPFFIGKWKPNFSAMEKDVQQHLENSDIPPAAWDTVKQFIQEMEWTFEEDGTFSIQVVAMGLQEETEGVWEITERLDHDRLIVRLEADGGSGFNPGNQPGTITRLSNGQLQVTPESDDGSQPSFPLVLQPLK